MQAAHFVETAAFFVEMAAKNEDLAAKIRAKLAAAFADEYHSVLPAGNNDNELFLALCPAAVLLDRAVVAMGDKRYAQAISLLTWAAAECTVPTDALLYVRARAYFDFGYDAVCCSPHPASYHRAIIVHINICFVSPLNRML